MASRLYDCRVMHQRHDRFAYRFDYRLLSLLIDIDEIDTLCSQSRWLRHNRRGFVSFHDQDHGPHDGSPLRPWIDGVLRESGIDLEGGRVELLSIPRIFGYAFNPLSVWYCYHADGRPLAILAEVSNTFGEWHHYLLHDHGRELTWPAHLRADKVFHVSPFIEMQAEYRFRFTEPGERLAIAINEYRDDDLLLVATQTGHGRPLNDRNLIRALLRFPFNSIKVMVLIHWQALKLWLRRAPFFAKPAPPDEDISR